IVEVARHHARAAETKLPDLALGKRPRAVEVIERERPDLVAFKGAPAGHDGSVSVLLGRGGIRSPFSPKRLAADGIDAYAAPELAERDGERGFRHSVGADERPLVEPRRSELLGESFQVLGADRLSAAPSDTPARQVQPLELAVANALDAERVSEIRT